MAETTQNGRVKTIAERCGRSWQAAKAAILGRFRVRIAVELCFDDRVLATRNVVMRFDDD